MRQLPILFLLGIFSFILPNEKAASPPAEVLYIEPACTLSKEAVKALELDFALHLKARETTLRTSSGLKRKEKRALRRSRNDEHVAMAKHAGVDRHVLAAELAGGEHLQCFNASSPYYVDFEVGVSRLTPAALKTLDLIGQRFHARLEAAGLPPVRFAVSSAYRSAKHQARLRRRNVNASRTVSSHEYGATFDITYRRFYSVAEGVADAADYAPPANLRAVHACASTNFQEQEQAWSTQMTEKYASRFAAELGRALIELESEGHVLALRERRQPCFHVTAAVKAGV